MRSITPKAIAQGYGDDYLIRLNRLFWAKKMRAYVRPLGEPNRCLNVYAVLRLRRPAAGLGPHSALVQARAAAHLHPPPRRRQAGQDRRAACRSRPAPRSATKSIGLPRAPIGVLWSTLPAGSPTVPQNRPRYFYPGNAYVDWVGTDFYSDNQDWKSLTGLYNRFSKKPFAIPEFGVSSGDDPGYVQHLIAWVNHHPRCQMLIYYQDFGSTSPYRIQNYPASLAVLDKGLHTPRFPAFLARSPDAPAAPAGRPASATPQRRASGLLRRCFFGFRLLLLRLRRDAAEATAALNVLQRGDARVAGQVEAAAVGDHRRVGAARVAEDAAAAPHHVAAGRLAVNSAA